MGCPCPPLRLVTHQLILQLPGKPGMETPELGYLQPGGSASPAGRCRCPWLKQPRTTSESWEMAFSRMLQHWGVWGVLFSFSA